MSEDRLKPCPFCGAEIGLLPSLGDPAEEVAGHHPENDCLFSGCGIHHSKFTKWNTRAPLKIVTADPIVFEDDSAQKGDEE